VQIARGVGTECCAQVRGQPRISVADVSGDEIRHLLERAANVKDVLETLGLTWSAFEAKRGVDPPTITAAVRE
jgi:hypothetical protein